MNTSLHIVQNKINLCKKNTKVDLLAVSKTWASSDIIKLYNQGQRLFGENKVQEAMSKFLSEPLVNMCDIELHMIGRLQRNKVKKALTLFDCIQSVNTMALIEKIVQESNNLKDTVRTKNIFFQINPHNDETKAGFTSLNELIDAVMYFVKNSTITLRGLMVIAPIDDDLSNTFGLTKLWAKKTIEIIIQKVSSVKNISNPLELSMGMSADFVKAIECGSTMVRVGSALFGDRTYE